MGQDETAIVVLFAAVVMSGLLSAAVSVYLYHDGIRCLFIKEDLPCAKDQLCHWVNMPDTELSSGKCVPRRYYTLSPDEQVRRSTGCAIVETEPACLAYKSDDCVWDIPKKMCKFHECSLKQNETDCASVDTCSWNASEKKCRKKVA